jgi:hypothetical protein
MRRGLLIVLAVLLGAPPGPAGAESGRSPSGDPADKRATVEHVASPSLGGGSPGSGRSGFADPATPLPARTAPAAAPDKPSKTASLPPPIAFFLARGDAGACGDNCSEWIGADGAFDANAAQRLRVVLDRLGRRKLPIYFHSPGGSVAGALAIGRLMRERGLTAGVGWTIPQGCDSRQVREDACDKIKRGGRELPAQLDTSRTMCNSACVYAVAGAAVREIAPSASLGIHSSSFRFIDSDGHASSGLSRSAVHVAVAASYARLERYLGEMGVDPALVTAAREISNEHIRFLTRAEIWRFNIDRRSFVEGRWTLLDDSSRAISKFFLSDIKGDHSDFRTGLIRLSCSAPDRLRVDVAREHSPVDVAASAATAIVIGGTSRALQPGRRAALSNSKTEFDISTANVAPAFFLAASDSVAISTAPEGPNAPAKPGEPALKLSTAGFAPVLGKLLSLCGIAPSTAKIGGAGLSDP